MPVFLASMISACYENLRLMSYKKNHIKDFVSELQAFFAPARLTNSFMSHSHVNQIKTGLRVKGCCKVRVFVASMSMSVIFLAVRHK